MDMASENTIPDDDKDVKKSSRGAGIVNVSDSEAGEIISKLTGQA